VKIEVICIGTEILLGDTLNTNLAFMGEVLAKAGYELAREICIPDEPPVMRAAIKDSLAAADLVITVGGLGPTADDLTKSVVSELLGLRLVHHAETEERILTRLAKRNITIPDQAIRTQALVPEGANVIVNRNGSAPGLYYKSAESAIVMLPGPPRELRPMFVETVMPCIQQLGAAAWERCVLRVMGMPESAVEKQVIAALAGYQAIMPAYCANPGYVVVRLTAPLSEKEALLGAAESVRTRLGEHVLPAECVSPAAAVGKLLQARGWFLATAESCTGGGIAMALTDIPGASTFFRGSIVSYANEWKHHELGVKAETLAAHGAVSSETVDEMLDGIMNKFGVDAAIAISGIAGPAGGTAEKPVGLVYIGTAVKQKHHVQKCVFSGDRAEVRTRAIGSALRQLHEELSQYDGSPPS